MKTLVLNAFFLLCFSIPAWSQNDINTIPIAPDKPLAPAPFSLGVTASFGHSFVIPYRNYRFNSSWGAGLSAIYSSWAHWGIGMDVTYSEEGSKVRSSDVTFDNELDYIRVPIKAIYFFKSYDHNFRPKVALGPTLGFTTSQINGPDANNFDFGVSGSMGFNYRIRKAVWLNVDLSYYQGFIDAYANNSEKDLNGNVRLNVGVNIGF